MVEWRWLEDANTGERFFALANDWDEDDSRQRNATKFKSYDELEQAVTKVVQDDYCRDCLDRKIANYSYCVFLTMEQKMGFPETSLYPWDQYHELALHKLWNRDKLSHGDRIDSVQGLVQYKYSDSKKLIEAQRQAESIDEGRVIGFKTVQRINSNKRPTKEIWFFVEEENNNGEAARWSPCVLIRHTEDGE